jgi:hypothetical protein
MELDQQVGVTGRFGVRYFLADPGRQGPLERPRATPFGQSHGLGRHSASPRGLAEDVMDEAERGQ